MRRVELFKKLSTHDWDSTAIVLEDANKVSVNDGMGKKKDTFSFEVLNAKNKYHEQKFTSTSGQTEFTLKFYPIPTEHLSGSEQKLFITVNDVTQTYTTDYIISSNTITFGSGLTLNDAVVVKYPVIESDDKIRIYQWTNALWSGMSTNDKTNALSLEGTITEPKIEINDSTNKIKIIGTGFIDQILKALAFARNEGLTKPHLIIQAVISQLNKYNPNRTIYGQDPTEWANIGNNALKSDGSAFDDIQYDASYKSAVEIIEELSADKFTGDGYYIYHVAYDDQNNRYELIWKNKDISVNSSNEITAEELLTRIKGGKNQDEIINAIIYNIGFDCNEIPWDFPNFGSTSQVSNGSKWKYVTETSNIISEILNTEFEADTSEWDTGNEGNRTENYPTSTSSWTFQFKERDDDGNITSVDATASSNKTFNDAVVNEAKWRGKETTDRIIDLMGNPKYKFNLTQPLTNKYILGELLEFSTDAFGLTKKKLRVIQIKKEFWDTIIDIEEDETTITEV